MVSVKNVLIPSHPLFGGESVVQLSRPNAYAPLDLPYSGIVVGRGVIGDPAAKNLLVAASDGAVNEDIKRLHAYERLIGTSVRAGNLAVRIDTEDLLDVPSDYPDSSSALTPERARPLPAIKRHSGYVASVQPGETRIEEENCSTSSRAYVNSHSRCNCTS